MIETSIKEGFYLMSIQVLKITRGGNANAVSKAIISHAVDDI